ncbi:membrane protein [Caballeronia arvi]|uniref:Membrane protein n=1 Tax=Caballeronia arvi TaxID=1777135 RepID=A0A158HJE4_9BURK|nr:aldolase [Caballeronia arvi]SAL44237.1 membrane protein [Caballeronia arvi]
MAIKLKVDPSKAADYADVDFNSDEIWQTRVDLAAVFRISAHYGFNEAVDNHYSALLPGRDDLFLINPYGYSFSELTASSLLVCDFHGNVLSGRGEPEASSFWIHARVHKMKPNIRCLLHAHTPNATALCALDRDPFDWSIQSSMRFYGVLSVDKEYNGLALDDSEGDRIARALGNAEVVFMRNHGVSIGAKTIAEAWDDLYFVERAAEAQVKAYSTGAKMAPVSHDIVAAVAKGERASHAASAHLHLESVKRFLNQTAPGYAS